jgi:hypothetical protein
VASCAITRIPKPENCEMKQVIHLRPRIVIGESVILRLGADRT